MASASKTMKKRGGDSTRGALLHGSDLPKSASNVVIFINAVREAPAEWNGPFVLDIDEVHGCKALAVNKSNAKRLAEMIDDDTDTWPGYEVTLARVRTTNPSTGGAAFGLEVESVKKSKRKPKVEEVPF